LMAPLKIGGAIAGNRREPAAECRRVAKRTQPPPGGQECR